MSQQKRWAESTHFNAVSQSHPSRLRNSFLSPPTLLWQRSSFSPGGRRAHASSSPSEIWFHTQLSDASSTTHTDMETGAPRRLEARQRRRAATLRGEEVEEERLRAGGVLCLLDEDPAMGHAGGGGEPLAGQGCWTTWCWMTMRVGKKIDMRGCPVGPHLTVPNCVNGLCKRQTKGARGFLYKKEISMLVPLKQ